MPIVPATHAISGTVIRRRAALMDQSLSSLAQKSGANHPTGQLLNPSARPLNGAHSQPHSLLRYTQGDQPARRPADANNSLPRLSRSRFSSCLCRRAHGNATAPLTERLDVGRSTPRASCPSYIDLPAAEGRINPRFCWDAVTILRRLSADTYLVAG